MAKTKNIGLHQAEFLNLFFEPCGFGLSSGPTAGNVKFVNSATGTDSSSFGASPNSPYASLNFAIGQCVASNGDRIYLMPGHTETLTAAAAVAVNVAGVSVIGMGEGRLRPVFNYTTSASASFDVTAANVLIQNIAFRPLGVAAVTTAVNVQAADVTFRNCEFELTNSTNQAALGILTTAAASRMLIDGCFFHATTDAGCTAAICIVGGDSIRIINSIFQGAYGSGVGAIQQITTATTNCMVVSNRIQNYTASCTKAMVFTSSSTGQISDNRMQILSGTAPITGAAMSWIGGNYYGASIATAGTLI